VAQSNAERQAAFRERQRRYVEADRLGRRYGEHEASLRGEEGAVRTGRIERAICYQRWLVDTGRLPA